MKRAFCDKCDQQLIEPDERIDFVTGKPVEGDICWQCRLREIVDMYNSKTREISHRAMVILHWDPPISMPVIVYGSDPQALYLEKPDAES